MVADDMNGIEMVATLSTTLEAVDFILNQCS